VIAGMKKQCIAMLLAGGQGSRLGILTKQVAKPAIPFGGKYRLIDFPLSNCANSGIDVVGVLTQYQPLELNRYIGSGQPWGLDLNSGGVFVLPPYVKGKSGEWYRGSANAIYQNISFIEQYNPDYVLVLSGDHIYKMDYSKFIYFHRRSKADATIAVREVSWEETGRFGIMNADDEGRIFEFEEKPSAPKSNKASMGVYVFDWPALKRYLIADAANPKSKNDFGKNIIPNMLADGLKLMAYGFNSYWMDVGTIESLWEANMHLIQEPPAFDLRDKAWRMYARNPIMPPHYTSEGASVSESLVTEGCDVSGVVERSVLFAGVRVESGAYVRDSVVMPGARILSGASLTHAIVGENSVVTARCIVGADPVEGKPLSIALVGQDTVLPEGYVVKPGDQVDADALAIESGAKA
jgi:glucose-1-phosphate adenylyltransferase